MSLKFFVKPRYVQKVVPGRMVSRHPELPQAKITSKTGMSEISIIGNEKLKQQSINC